MKNNSTLQRFLVAVLLLSITITSFYACKKNEETHKPLESLKEDSRFIGVINDNMTLIRNANGNEEALKLITKKDPTALELDKFSVILGFKNFTEYSIFVKNQDEILLQLKKEYQLANVDPNSIKNIGIEAMNNRKSLSIKSTVRAKVSVADPSGGGNICEKIRVNCLVEVASIATAAHIVCIAADLTVILGTICHGAAIAYQVAAGNTCNLEAQQCNSVTRD